MLWNPRARTPWVAGSAPMRAPDGRTGKSGRPAAGINLSCRILSRTLQ